MEVGVALAFFGVPLGVAVELVDVAVELDLDGQGLVDGVGVLAESGGQRLAPADGPPR